MPLTVHTRGLAVRGVAAGLLLMATLLTACGDGPVGETAALLIPPAAGQTSGGASVPGSGKAAGPLRLTLGAERLELQHLADTELPVILTSGDDPGGPVELRLERADGRELGEVVRVSPDHLTLGRGDTAVTLRLKPTRLALTSGGAADWRLVVSRGGQELDARPLSLSLKPLDLRFTFQPISAREGETVEATLTVDSSSRDVPPFSFTLAPYIPEETRWYALAGDPSAPARYQVERLPATFQVPVLLKTFHGLATDRTDFELSVNGLTDLGSPRYGPKYLRAKLVWILLR